MFKFNIKYLKKGFLAIIVILSLVGLFSLLSYLAIAFGWTNEKGEIDINNRKFEIISQNYQLTDKDTNEIDQTEIQELGTAIYKLAILNSYFPKNARQILEAYKNTQDLNLLNRMIAAVVLKVKDSIDLEKEFDKNLQSFQNNFYSFGKKDDAFEWSELPEWKALKVALLKDKPLIDSVANLLGMESRLIVTVLISEQIRLFSTHRENFKKVISPLVMLVVGSKISFGVTGIKENTAIEVERNLKNPKSPFYLGKKYENLLKFRTGNPEEERMNRLINYRNHYYSYLYAGLILKQIREQWKKAGYDISDRPEILATLYNVGFRYSNPKPYPIVGGSRLEINGRTYTFGGIAFEFYYSGELQDEFPFQKIKWRDDYTDDLTTSNSQGVNK